MIDDINEQGVFRGFEVEPFEGESLSHFLGRFRRENYMTVTTLGKLTGLGAVVSRWEKFYLNPFPTQKELKALASVVGIKVERLMQMLPPKGRGAPPRPIRLCAACYVEYPYHRVDWHLKDSPRCAIHQVQLLSKCINCGNQFPIPSKWLEGECSYCMLPFASMVKRQKAL